MTRLSATIEGIGFWCNGLPDWASARAFARNGALPEGAPTRPSPQLLAPNERRRAPDTVAVALDVALAACTASGRAPAALPSVFASTHGDLGITDYMSATLADNPTAISPTRFHNSVHNAAAGYWTIGAGCTQSTTAISAFDASFAEALLEALVQLNAGEPAVLLAAYDGPATGPLASVSQTTGLMGGALVLSHATHDDAPRLEIEIVPGEAPAATGRLHALAGGNAMAPMLPLFEALASGATSFALHAGPGRVLRGTLSQAMPQRADADAGVAHA